MDSDVTIKTGARRCGHPEYRPPVQRPLVLAVLKRFHEEGLKEKDGRRIQFRHAWVDFERSLGEVADAIRSEADFDASTFLRQAEWIRLEMQGCPESRREELKLLCAFIPPFYRYVEKKLGRPVFAEGAVVTPVLLSTTGMSKFLRGGALFTVWSGAGMRYVPGRDYYVVSCHGMDGISSRMSRVDFVTVDLSPVPERFKEMVFRYEMSTPRRVVSLHNCAMTKTIMRLLDEYVGMKAVEGYPNPDLRVMTDLEMDHMREFIVTAYPNATTANTFIGLFRDFVQWAIAERYVKGSIKHLLALHAAKEPGKGRQEAISAPHFVMLMKRAEEQSTVDTFHACCYVALRLFILTDLRVSELCGLRRDCFVQTADCGVWQVAVSGKTSRAGKDRQTVTDAERRAAQALDAATAPLRDRAAALGLGENLFIYEGRSGVRVLTRQMLALYLRRLCDDLDLPHYEPRHIRACRKTRAARFAEKHGLSKQDTAMLTGHKNPETTMNAYVSVKASDYYAALYGVMTEDVQAGVRGRVVEDMPQGVEPAAGDGAALGACSKADICTARTLLPCLTCPSFVTDVHHLNLFEQAVKDLDGRIAEATVEHDREDLVSIKEIYVVFIQKIKEVLWQKQNRK